ncbi:hypothetical protein [Arcobacter arenosus]|uniref:Uncharacterized protein n=1 Tax=Arcobacter arenosus TaxID=2576037 RepID=A0A5R8XZN3_9BACT|nr:hypothetical protein [Arcobacter arenosus]TLP37077.1 hypothetical protein FDK22_12600 [Arcobacter arenosus]
MYKLVFILAFLIIGSYANDNLQEKNLQKQIEKEKKYKEEQKFYQGKNYDLDSFKVDENSLKNIPEQKNYNEDFDMDHTYD